MHVILGGGGGVWKLPGMMDMLDNSWLFFLQMFTQHQLGLKPLSITLPSAPPPLLLSLSNELFSSGDGTGTQSIVINNLLFSFTN